MTNAWYHALVIGVSALIANGVIRPGWVRYRIWRNDPNRIKTARRNWRGEYVPDLALIRAERALWSSLVLLWILGLLVLWTIFTRDLPPQPL